VLKGNAAYGGDVSTTTIKHLLVEFNCLREGEEDVTIVLGAKHFQPISLTFRKQCPRSRIFFL